MKTMKVKDLREALVGVPDNASVVFQANEPGEEDKAGEATHTFAYGTVFEAWVREPGVINPVEFVIDGEALCKE